MVGFALLGAGRIGNMHASIIAAHPQAELLYIYDTHQISATKAAKTHGSFAADSVEQILNDDRVQAVLIATSTDTHVDLLTRFVKAGKAVLCEKPIDLDFKKVEACWDTIKNSAVPVQIGFNRRYDPSHRSLQEAVSTGEFGKLEQLIITSRDPGLPPIEYLKGSGGLFRDMAIHDFDLARFILGEEPIEIQVLGSVLVDKQVAEMGDIDSAMIIMKTATGKLIHINCSRRCAYGYDQRVEAFCEKGMLLSDNPHPNGLTKYSSDGTGSKGQLHEFFIERYQDAYRNQLGAFVEGLLAGTPVHPSFKDGLAAQALVEAAQEALETGLPVKLK